MLTVETVGVADGVGLASGDSTLPVVTDAVDTVDVRGTVGVVSDSLVTVIGIIVDFVKVIQRG